ncbi:low molecular weight phosphotyrosine protein phosphatase [bacterium]|nr:low molecular weight phosphotyrosine protein phosphatase [bacterium]
MTSAKVLFVCLGNICRSPTAQGVFEHQVQQAGIGSRVTIDSAGTAAYHLGKAPDSRAMAAARQRGYRLDDLRARQVSHDDFYRFDWILAMDAQNLADLQALQPDDSNAHLGLFLDLIEGTKIRQVPDPYYGGAQGFEQVLDLCEAAGSELLRRLERGS